MSSDRSTLQRGQPGGPEQQPFWPEPTSPAGRRLPSAPRERKPALAALAVLLIVGCALGTGLLVVQSGKRVAAIEVSGEIGAGQRIPLSALTEVQIASNTGLSYVPWSEAAQVSRYFAADTIPPGTLLTSAMVARASTSTAGRDLVGLVLKDGQVPRELLVGDHVEVYKVSDAEDACPGTPGNVLAANAIVTGITQPSATSGNSGGEDVDLAVNPRAAGPVACNASNGVAGITVLPANGQGAAAAAPSIPPTAPASNPAASTTPPATPRHSLPPQPGGGDSVSPSKRVH
ncbi:MAG TPA: hypothetical protein VK586_22905 [Streptosporangiaceae bacterium]|nr:hypothetical protein [Streptosporangiaceae bacterium]